MQVFSKNIQVERFEQKRNAPIFCNFTLRKQQGSSLLFVLSLLSIMLSISACFTPQQVFTPTNEIEEENINGFYAVNVFEDHLSKDVWFSDEGDCLIVEGDTENAYSGEGGLHIKWDKVSGNCPWLGIGFGWDGWNGKNLANIYATTAIQFRLKAVEGEVKSFPVAMAFEDYSNLQAWAGFNSKMFQGEADENGWRTVTVPILAFNWLEMEADISNIKQFMIQFEAAGDVYLDEVKIVEFSGGLRKRAELMVSSESVNIEELLENVSDENANSNLSGRSNIQLQVNKGYLIVVAEVEDDTPLENSQKESEIWNGDALEIALSVDPTSSQYRSYYLPTDHQIGIRANEDPMVWNWRKNRKVPGAQVLIKKLDNGYRLAAKIPLREFGITAFEAGQIYGLEMAIDKGTINGRTEQLRWNSPDVGGLHENPSLWGEMLIFEID